MINKPTEKLRINDEKVISDLFSDLAPKANVVGAQLPDIGEVKDGSLIMTKNGNIEILYIALDGKMNLIQVMNPKVVNGTLPDASKFPQSTQIILDDGTDRTLYIKDETSWKLVKIL